VLQKILVAPPVLGTQDEYFIHKLLKTSVIQYVGKILDEPAPLIVISKQFDPNPNPVHFQESSELSLIATCRFGTLFFGEFSGSSLT
jgi:serine kinase of HPr protein (carbohydrate metabolism regulator)